MNEIANQNLEINPVDLNVSEALHAVTALTEGEINPNNITQSEDSLWNLFNTISSPQLKIFILILFMAYFGITPEEIAAQQAFPDNVTPITETITTHPTGYGLRLRAQPHLNGEILDSLSTEDTVKIFGYDTATGKWAFVDKDGDEQADGFVFADFLALDGFNSAPEISTRTITMHGINCDVNGTYRDSQDDLCAIQFTGTIIFYAHNFTDFGKTILSLSNNIGAIVSTSIDGVDFGQYRVISSHKYNGTNTKDMVSPEVRTSINNEKISFVTTDPALEGENRIVITLEKVVE